VRSNYQKLNPQAKTLVPKGHSVTERAEEGAALCSCLQSHATGSDARCGDLRGRTLTSTEERGAVPQHPDSPSCRLFFFPSCLPLALTPFDTSTSRDPPALLFNASSSSPSPQPHFVNSPHSFLSLSNFARICLNYASYYLPVSLLDLYRLDLDYFDSTHTCQCTLCDHLFVLKALAFPLGAYRALRGSYSLLSLGSTTASSGHASCLLRTTTCLLHQSQRSMVSVGVSSPSNTSFTYALLTSWLSASHDHVSAPRISSQTDAALDKQYPANGEVQPGVPNLDQDVSMEDAQHATTNGVKRKASSVRPDFAEAESSDDDLPLVRPFPRIIALGSTFG